MKTQSFACLSAATTLALVLSACNFAHSSTLHSTPTEIEPDLVVKYLHTRADLIEKSGKLQQPLNELVNEMISDCKAKKLGESITLNANGLPVCFRAPEPVIKPGPNAPSLPAK
jgi:hypothetical protein